MFLFLRVLGLGGWNLSSSLFSFASVPCLAQVARILVSSVLDLLCFFFSSGVFGLRPKEGIMLSS